MLMEFIMQLCRHLPWTKNALSLAFVLSSTVVSAAGLPDSVIHQIAPNNGWAAMEGGTSGGAKATAQHTYKVTDNQTLRDALTAAGEKAKIIEIVGVIDLSGGKPYTSFADQKARSLLRVPNNTTIIGVTKDAGFIKGSVIVSKVHNVIIRNVKIESPVDVSPHFEKGDGWNAEWDGMNIITSEHIWIDHVTFSDGQFTDSMYTEKEGREYVQHDGELDIKRASDYITISNTLFENHDKTMLIGHSDKNAKQDEGKLRITLVDNVFDSIVQRTPRVRFGHVHVYNNLFKGDHSNDHPYRYGYSFGIGAQSHILSENNQFDIKNIKSNCKIYKDLSHGKNGQLIDVGSIVNGTPLQLKDCGLSTTQTWKAPYPYQLKPAAELASLVNTVGAGKL